MILWGIWLRGERVRHTAQNTNSNESMPYLIAEMKTMLSKQICKTKYADDVLCSLIFLFIPKPQQHLNAWFSESTRFLGTQVMVGRGCPIWPCAVCVCVAGGRFKGDTLYHQVWAWLSIPSGSKNVHLEVCWIDQPTQWTVATGRLINPPYFWVDTPTCDVTKRRWHRFLKPPGMANQAHTWCYIVNVNA